MLARIQSAEGTESTTDEFAPEPGARAVPEPADLPDVAAPDQRCGRAHAASEEGTTPSTPIAAAPDGT
jgi:hypothetical protein